MEDRSPVEPLGLKADHGALIDRLDPVAIAATGAAVWLRISYPKRSRRVPSEVPRSVGWEPAAAADRLDIPQISNRAVWSALRSKPEAAIPRQTPARPGAAVLRNRPLGEG